MTSINSSSMGPYLNVFTPSVKKDDGQPTDAASATSEGVTVRSVFKPLSDTSETGSSEATSPSQQAIKQLQEQIKEVQKRLLEQQQQLAAAQNSKTPEPEKSQQVMAIQQGISGTMAQLTALQASLLELMKGTVDVTA
jgi:predicted ribosome quality control (RQC) complex YloA/Tae2 family protein